MSDEKFGVYLERREVFDRANEACKEAFKNDKVLNGLLESVAEDLHSKGSNRTEDKHQLLKLRYYLRNTQSEDALAELTLEEIANLTGYTPARIGQIVNEGLQKYRDSDYFQDDGELGGSWYIREDRQWPN